MFPFYHISDTHYYSHKNYEGDPFALPQFHDQIAMRESPEIISSVFDAIIADKETDTVIYTGDLTHHGDEWSHTEFIALLDKLEKNGKKVWAFTDFHDYPGENFGFTFDKFGKQHPKNSMEKDAVIAMYNRFGHGKARSVYKDGISYVADISENIRYLAMSYVHLGNGPELTDEYMQWVKEQAAEAKKDGSVIIAGIHPPFLCPSPVYKIMGKGNVVFESEKRAKQLADMGINLVLSGHSHIQDMSYVVSDSGKPFYDVSTSSTVGCPPRYRKIIIDTDKKTADIKTLIPEVPELNLITSLTEYCREGFLGSLTEIPYNMEFDVEKFAATGGGISLPGEKIRKHKRLVKKIGHILNNLTFAKLGRFTKKETGLKKADYADIKDKKIVPYIFEVVGNLYTGNADVSPDSAEFKITMGTVAALDSFIRLFRINLKSITGYSTLKEIIEPLVFNNGLDDDNLAVNLNIAPKENKPLPVYHSNKAGILFALIILICIVLLPITIVIVLAVLAAVLIKKLK